MRPLRIAVMGHVRFPIARPFRGGMEAHCWHLARGLRARGHDVTLFASGDSAAGCRLHPVLKEHYDRSYPWHLWNGTPELTGHLDHAHARAIEELRDSGFDIVHNNSLHRFPPRMARRDRIAMLTSLHVPPFPVLHRAVRDGIAPWSRFTVSSDRQRRAWWPNGAPPEAHVLPNGIDLDDWPFATQGEGGAVWSGRITATKAPHLAARAARIAGLPLSIFGPVENEDYFEAELRPLLGGEIRYGGHLSAADLSREVARASVLFFTPLWDEPFGLSAIEAMACGVPVAATDMGAVREVIGPAGRFAPPDDPEALARAALDAMQIPRRVPRDRVERLYALDIVLDRTESLYRETRRGLDHDAAPVVFKPIELPERAKHPVR
ncbi:glycosyltransferase [Palleronia sp. LCG004]|uniref:glycosyltransferase n=1 Tax=Palleronia sp. LCG004 TaxID=3079304 RepID=UPI002943F598|nr:glycosyltransferase [Palleronia sp. LCG004]WOI56248.1 glycosyltransferase [Palleronia sp. LCG004]